MYGTTAKLQFDASIVEILAEWGDAFLSSTDRLIRALEPLYRAALVFPPIWPEHRREAFIISHADLDGGDLSDQFDDLIDVVTNRFGRQHGYLPHSEDAVELIRKARLEALDEFVDSRIFYELPAEIELEAHEDPGRGDGSMTACGGCMRRKPKRC